MGALWDSLYFQEKQWYLTSIRPGINNEPVIIHNSNIRSGYILFDDIDFVKLGYRELLWYKSIYLEQERWGPVSNLVPGLEVM